MHSAPSKAAILAECTRCAVPPVKMLAKVLAIADGEQLGNSYAINAYNAGVDSTIEYWDALADAAIRVSAGLKEIEK
jgi:hypothetical protein